MPLIDFQEDNMYLSTFDRNPMDFVNDHHASIFDDMRIPISETRVNPKPPVMEETDKCMTPKSTMMFDDLFSKALVDPLFDGIAQKEQTPFLNEPIPNNAQVKKPKLSKGTKENKLDQDDVDYISSDSEFEESVLCLNGCGKRKRFQCQQKPMAKQVVTCEPKPPVEVPPRCCVLEDVVHAVNQVNIVAGNEYLRFVEHPPLEVRTRTKKEKRSFSCTVDISSRAFASGERVIATVSLMYATDTSTKLDTLGGTVELPVSTPGLLELNDLTVSVASPKHDEREFCLCITLSSCPNAPVYSRPFYGFSHKSVLKRRKDIDLRAISGASGTSLGGTAMHVVGTPFVKSERLEVVFRVKKSELTRNGVAWETEAVVPIPEKQKKEMYDALIPEKSTMDDSWLSFAAKNVEWYSDSVIFFETPDTFKHATGPIWTFIQVTNDSRYYSKPLPFLFK